MQQKVKAFLDRQLLETDPKHFIKNDPVSVPHSFKEKNDIEIAAFFAALLSWGNRITIIKKASELMERMNNAPYSFVMQNTAYQEQKLEGFKHRTINEIDCLAIVIGLKSIYKRYGDIEQLMFEAFSHDGKIKSAIIAFRKAIFSISYPIRTKKHIGSPENGSASKRMNMFLRWMIRNDSMGIDLGLWQLIPKKSLMCPLDLHTGNASRNLGLLKRKVNDWQAVEDLTKQLQLFDREDPIKYDIALFNAGLKIPNLQ